MPFHAQQGDVTHFVIFWGESGWLGLTPEQAKRLGLLKESEQSWLVTCLLAKVLSKNVSLVYSVFCDRCLVYSSSSLKKTTIFLNFSSTSDLNP
jgi:hypothetical protein